MAKRKTVRPPKTNLRPKPEAVAQIIEEIRAAFLECGIVTEEMLCFVSLMEVIEILRIHFSKAETLIIKERIKEMRRIADRALLTKFSIIDDFNLVFALMARQEEINEFITETLCMVAYTKCSFHTRPRLLRAAIYLPLGLYRIL